MSNNKAAARLIFSLIFCAFVFVMNFYGVLVSDADYTSNPLIVAASGDFISQTNTDKTNANEQKESVNDENAELSKIIETASNGNIMGNVIEKFISPYTANTSYKNVYLKNSTDLNIDIKSLLNAKLPYKLEKNGKPQVLILHTHATESFLTSSRNYYTDKDSSRSTDERLNMLALGNIVTDTLNNAGIMTLHDKTLHDYPSYNESYSRAADTICSYKEKYPDIKIVIDLHRDAISSGDSDKVKVTTEIDGKKAAQVMLVMGSQSGNVKNFPNYQENLKLALKIQKQLESDYPTLARSLSLMPRNYNESLTTGSVLIEIGTDANSLEEVKYSAQLLANSLAKLFAEL